MNSALTAWSASHPARTVCDCGVSIDGAAYCELCSLAVDAWYSEQPKCRHCEEPAYRKGGLCHDCASEVVQHQETDRWLTSYSLRGFDID